MAILERTLNLEISADEFTWNLQCDTVLCLLARKAEFKSLCALLSMVEINGQCSMFVPGDKMGEKTICQDVDSIYSL
jgi:hypothetical protein